MKNAFLVCALSCIAQLEALKAMRLMIRSTEHSVGHGWWLNAPIIPLFSAKGSCIANNLHGSIPSRNSRLWRLQSKSLNLLSSSASVIEVEDAARHSQTLDDDDHGGKWIILKRNRQSKAFWNGSQLVFSRAIQEIQNRNQGSAQTMKSQKNHALQMGDFVRVAVQPEKSDPASTSIPILLGWGVYNPHSMYAVRILCHKQLQPLLNRQLESTTRTKEALEQVIIYHLTRAIALRRSIHLELATTRPENNIDGYHTSNVTDTFRLINGEGDGVSGLAVDVIGGRVAVVMSSAAWCEVHKVIVLAALRRLLPDHFAVIWKTAWSRLNQDGYNNTFTSEESSVNSECIVSTENGVHFQTNPFLEGQKTGFYCDQRENRWLVAQHSANKTVLDLCCYHGGFSLTAVAKGMALSAVGVDSSMDAIKTCQFNAELNHCTDRVTYIQADVSEFMKESSAQGNTFDIVVLDPPKLAPSLAVLEKARRKYHGLNRDAMKLVNPENGGLLLSCTCSAAMTQKDGGQYFLAMVHGAALAAGRAITLLRTSGAASCHTQSPISWPAGAYLTAALFYVHPI